MTSQTTDDTRIIQELQHLGATWGARMRRRADERGDGQGDLLAAAVRECGLTVEEAAASGFTAAFEAAFAEDVAP